METTKMKKERERERERESKAEQSWKKPRRTVVPVSKPIGMSCVVSLQKSLSTFSIIYPTDVTMGMEHVRRMIRDIIFVVRVNARPFTHAAFYPFR